MLYKIECGAKLRPLMSIFSPRKGNRKVSLEAMESTSNMYDDTRKRSLNGNGVFYGSSGAESGDLIFHTRFVSLFEQGSCRVP